MSLRKVLDRLFLVVAVRGSQSGVSTECTQQCSGHNLLPASRVLAPERATPLGSMKTEDHMVACETGWFVYISTLVQKKKNDTLNTFSVAADVAAYRRIPTFYT